MPCGDIGQANVSACSLGFAPSQRAPSFTIDQAMEERNQSLGSL